MKNTCIAIMMTLGVTALTAPADLLVRLDFNDFDPGTSTSLLNTGTIGKTFAARPNFSFSVENESPAGKGYSGSFSTSLNNPGVYLEKTDVAAALEGLNSFTISAWVKDPPASGSRRLVSFFDVNKGFQFHFVNSGANVGLSLVVNGGNVASTQSDYNPSGWNFYAVTYDGTAGSENVRFFVGDGTTLSQFGDTVSLNQGAIQAPANASSVNNRLNIGHATGVAGINLMDQFRIHGDVLTQAELQSVMTYVDVIPEPATVGMIWLGALTTLLVRRRIIR